MRATSIKEPVAAEFQASYLVDGDAHRWLIPAAGMEVCLHADALSGLAHDLAVVRKRARAGEEIGGLLFGCRDFIGRNSVRIARIQTYSASSLHQLLGLMCTKAGGRAAGEDSDSSVVGWYRIASREETGISREDESLMRMHFPDPGNVFLMLRPSELHLVFWRGNDLKRATAEFAALPVLLAPAPAPAAAPDPPPPKKKLQRIWLLAGISLLTATLVFTAGVLSNQPTAHRAVAPTLAPERMPIPHALLNMERGAKTSPLEKNEPAPEAGFRAYGPSAPVERRPFTQPVSAAATPQVEPALPPPAPTFAGAPAAAIPNLPLAAVERPPQPVAERPAEPVSPQRPATAAVAELIPAAVVKKVDPVAPPVARRLTQAVTIQVRLTVDAKGEVVDAEALGVKGDLNTQLSRAALDAARRWKFMPAMLSGQPVLSTTTVSFVFRPAR